MPILYAENIAPYAQGRRINSEEWNGISRTLAGEDNVGFGVPVA